MRKAILISILTWCFFTHLKAQIIPGPSDTVTAAPTVSAPANKNYCTGETITLTVAVPTGITVYTWYKLSPTGSLEQSIITKGMYTETAGATGWYYYQVMTANTQGCTSPLSDVFKVYVSPLSKPKIQ